MGELTLLELLFNLNVTCNLLFVAFFVQFLLLTEKNVNKSHTTQCSMRSLLLKLSYLKKTILLIIVFRFSTFVHCLQIFRYQTNKKSDVYKSSKFWTSFHLCNLFGRITTRFTQCYYLFATTSFAEMKLSCVRLRTIYFYSDLQLSPLLAIVLECVLSLSHSHSASQFLSLCLLLSNKNTVYLFSMYVPIKIVSASFDIFQFGTTPNIIHNLFTYY